MNQSQKPQTWTILSLLNWATDYFTRHEIPMPRLDAEVLLACTLGLERLQLYLKFERVLTPDELASFKEKIQRRVKGEPVSYIRGLKEFWSLPLKVGPGVLIPRPDTEVLVESVKKYVGARSPVPLLILDIGTGSGNIAIALAKEFPTAQITAIDVSEEALSYARENAREHGVEKQIVFINTDFLSNSPQPPLRLRGGALDSSPLNLRGDRGGLPNIIVSNPPYIPTKVFETLEPGIKNFEPRLALDGGADGLDFYRRMGEVGPSLLVPGGLIAVEIAEEQGRAVSEIFEKVGLKDIRVIKDYSGLGRVVTANL